MPAAAYLVDAQSEGDSRAHDVALVAHPLLLHRVTAGIRQTSVVIFRFYSALLQILRGALSIFAGETVDDAALQFEIVAANVLVDLVPHIVALGTHLQPSMY